MTTTQDCSIGFKKESVFKTGVTVDRWLETIGDWKFTWNKQVKQGQGLRVGARVPRSGRRVVPAADGALEFTTECTSKGMGTLWELLMGAGASTLVSGSTFQQVFTLADSMPSATIQQGLPEAGGTVDAHTMLGSVASEFEFAFANNDIAMLKASFDVADGTTATGYAAPSYATSPNLFHFANATLNTGTLTAPTSTALGSAATPTSNIRGGVIKVNHKLTNDRFNMGGAGRKAKQLPGLREISGTLQIEYDSTTYRDLVLNDGALCIVVTFTAGALSTGLETLQVIVPEVKLDGDLPAPNDDKLIVQSISFTGLDNLTAAQPIWVVTRTADSAL